MLLEQYINFFNWLYAFLRKFKTLNLLFSFSQHCKCPKTHWLELDLLQVCGSIGTGLRSSNVLVFQAEGASHHSNGSWWRGKENISISCLLLYISINMPTPLAYKCWQLWGNGLWYNGWNLDRPALFLLNNSLSVFLQGWHHVPFQLLEKYKKEDNPGTDWDRNPLQEGICTVCHLQTLGTILLHCLKIGCVKTGLKTGSEIGRTVISQKLFWRFWQVLPRLPVLPHSSTQREPSCRSGNKGNSSWSS